MAVCSLYAMEREHFSFFGQIKEAESNVQYKAVFRVSKVLSSKSQVYIQVESGYCISFCVL